MNVDMALADLQKGINVVASEWRKSGHTDERVTSILAVGQAVSWGRSKDGVSVDLDSTGDDDIRVVVLEGNPDPRTNLHAGGQAFQTWTQFGDGTPTVYVQPISCTPLWTGIILCHELDHAMEYRDGDSIPGEELTAWNQAEARAYLHEGLLIDGITGGRFRRSVEGWDLADMLSRRVVDVASDLYHNAFVGAVKQQPRSDREQGNRRSGLAAAGAMLIALDEFGDSETALGGVYGSVARAWFGV